MSSLFGPFDPDRPVRIKGPFSELLAAEAVEIAAPLALVWRVLTEFAAYSEWNPLNRSFALEGTTPGARLTFGVSWGPYTKDGRLVPVRALKTHLTQKERLTVWQPERCFAYADDWGRWHRAERVQAIAALPDGRTRYHTYERWAGRLTGVIGLLYARKARAGFAAASTALKARAEALAR